jgi:hypothetical protein
MVRVYWPAVFIVATDVPAMCGALSSGVVAFLTDRHQVLRIKEERHVPFVIPSVMDNRAIWCRCLAYEEPTAARPLAGPVVSIEYPLSQRAPSRERV